MSLLTVDPQPSSLDPAQVDEIVNHADRIVPLDAVHNFRDLGGYVLGDGRAIAWGRLFRADGLYRLTDSDLEVIDALGIRTVIDLRSSDELTDHGSFPVDKLPVGFHHLPIIDATWDRSTIPQVDDTTEGATEFLVWAYRDMLDAGPDRFAHAIQLLAVPGSAPAVFHCAAGKDRTGILAALVLAGLGVDDEVVIADYAITEAGMVRMRAWVEVNRPDMAERMGETPSFMLAAHPDAMRRILADLGEQHGSVRGYLSSIGVGTAVLETLADALTR